MLMGRFSTVFLFLVQNGPQDRLYMCFTDQFRGKERTCLQVLCAIAASYVSSRIGSSKIEL